MPAPDELRARLTQLLPPDQVGEIIPAFDEVVAWGKQLEGSLSQAEARAAEGEARLREEGGRVEKLWEAFKGQERDVWDLKERASRLEADVQGHGDTAARLEGVISERDAEIRRLQEGNDSLQEKIVALEERLETLAEVDALRAQADEYKAKHADYVERLAKLYALYEEAQGERDAFKKEVGARDQWFDDNADALRTISTRLKWKGLMVRKKV